MRCGRYWIGINGITGITKINRITGITKINRINRIAGITMITGITWISRIASLEKRTVMIFREAGIEDIEQILFVRKSVHENKLLNPDEVTDKDCVEFLTQRGKGWVCEIDNKIVGFSIVDMLDKNVWALFLKPEFEKQGIGRKLHDIMLNWYFEQTKDNVWLGTLPQTRAEKFYRKSGWTEIGTHGKDEIKFEMTYQDYRDYRDYRD